MVMRDLRSSLERRQMITTDEIVKEMRDALKGDPKELFSALARIMVQFFNRELVN